MEHRHLDCWGVDNYRVPFPREFTPDNEVPGLDGVY